MTSGHGLIVAPDFSLAFGKVARTLQYSDSAGVLIFTFDGSKEQGKLVLEHWAPATPRDSRYAVAFQRCREFLESRGYKVDIWGK